MKHELSIGLVGIVLALSGSISPVVGQQASSRQASQRAILQGHTRMVYAVAFSPDGKTLASGSADTTIKLWDVATGQERAALKGHTNVAEGVCFSPDGQRLASVGKDQTVRVWDAQSGQEVLVLKRPNSGICANVCFSPDGQRLASGSFGVTVWEARSDGSKGD